MALLSLLSRSLERWNAPGSPLARLPRPAAILLLIALVCACWWSVTAVGQVSQAADLRAAQQAEVIAKGGTGDLDLYRAIDARMARGEDYYHAAVAEHLAGNYPTAPFFVIRSPVLAWGVELFGVAGWRLVGGVALLASIAALLSAAPGRTILPERAGAALLIVLCGIGAVGELAGLVHELMSGVLLSLALLLYRPGRWWPSLLAAAAALAIRELALPFVLLWFAFAAVERRRNEALAVLALLILFALAATLHAQAVIAVRPPDVQMSQGWSGMGGPQAFFGAIVRLTPLALLPAALAAPLAVLPLLGWLGLGGRLGLFATVWFAGFLLAMALFARPENFYWGMLVLPAYAAGLAFVPRALAALWQAMRA